jgi:molecular chaperone DnaK
VRKTLVEAADKVEEDEKTHIESAIVELEEASSGEDVEAIQNKTNTLMEASHKLAEKMYQESAASDDSAESGGAGDAAEGDVVDAEFEEVEEVKDDKNQ